MTMLTILDYNNSMCDALIRELFDSMFSPDHGSIQFCTLLIVMMLFYDNGRAYHMTRMLFGAVCIIFFICIHLTRQPQEH